jgi:hypothetical protein
VRLAGLGMKHAELLCGDKKRDAGFHFEPAGFMKDETRPHVRSALNDDCLNVPTFKAVAATERGNIFSQKKTE